MKLVRGAHVALVAAISAILFTTVSGSVAHADPVDDLERQLNQQWTSLESTIEQFNQTVATLKQTKIDITAASERAKPMQVQVDAAHARIGALSAAAYMGGKASTANALLNSGSANTMLDQMTMLDAIGSNERRQIDELNRLKAPLDAEKNRIQTLLDSQTKMETDLAAKKVTITANMDSMQQQRTTAIKDRASRSGTRIDYVPPFIYGPPGKAVNYAMAQLGKPYVWATAGPDTFDCSGLTLMAWAQGGVTLGHYTGWQRDATTPTPRAQIQPGDLVFYGSEPHHVGLYIGGGNMVHASQPGEPIKISSIDNFGETPYFGRPHYK